MYSSGGRLRTRVWARGLSTFYTNNGSGDLTDVGYTNSGVINTTYTLDRLGRRTTVVDRGGTHVYTLHDSGLVIAETNTSGTLAGIGMVYQYDQFLRKTNVKVFSGNGLVLNHSYGFDGVGRLNMASDGSTTVGYSYIANSPLIGQTFFTNGGTVRMTTTKKYDYLGRLLGIGSVAFQTNVVSSDYTYNDANQRTANRLADGSYWIYEYDSLGQVTSGKKYWSDGTAVAGQQFEYSFDDIGNRTSASMGGDASARNLRTASYTANNLNQYTSRINPDSVDMLGVANPNATVTVNGQSTYRKGEYFQASLSATNALTNVFQVASNLAVLVGATNATSGGITMPKVNQTFTYDADGNLTSDSMWTYVWDAENRLTLATNGNIANLTVQRLDMIYDSLGRRLRLRVQTNAAGTMTTLKDVHFVYDGWNLVAELNTTNNYLINGYLWGADLSGEPNRAGGVGGLLAVTNSGTGSHLVYSDAIGNVASIVSLKTGNFSAEYEYGPYGELIRATGTAAGANRIRFASKYEDEMGLVYYGFRYFDRTSGRWISRDPLQESGGHNRYAFVDNKSVNRSDFLGLAPSCCRDKCPFPGAIRIDGVAAMIIPFGEDPEHFHAVEAAVKAAEKLKDNEPLITGDWIGLAVDSMLPGLEHLFEEATGPGGVLAKEYTAIYTTIKYSVCERQSCLLFWTHLDWTKHKLPDGPRRFVKTAPDPTLGYEGYSQAQNALGDAIADHIKEIEEFWKVE